MLIERSSTSKRKYSGSKTKIELQLPKINRTNLLLNKQKQNQSLHIPYAVQVSWVNNNTEYSRLTNTQIQDEYIKLRKELNHINMEVEKALHKLDLRLMRKSRIIENSSDKTLELKDKEVQNNSSIITRLGKEYFMLQKKLTAVTVNSKDEIEIEIQKAKEEIENCKLKIKELKMKNKNIGDCIVGSDTLLEEIKRLETQKEVQEKKKMKLQSKTDQIYDQISSIEFKLEQINDSYLIAENFFQEYDGQDQLNLQQKDMQLKLQHAKHCLEIITRKNETSSNAKQQKYHLLLKKLESEEGKLNSLDNKTGTIEMQIIHSKKILSQLEVQYKENEGKLEILTQQPIFFTEFQSDAGDMTSPQANNCAFSQLRNEKVSQKSKTWNKTVKQQFPVTEQRKYEKIISDTRKTEHHDEISELKKSLKEKIALSESKTEIGEDLPLEHEVSMMSQEEENDKQIEEFKSKIIEEKVRRKSKQSIDLTVDLSQLKQKIDKFDFIKANDDSFD